MEPRIIEELNLDPETVAAVRKGMYLVTQGEGTAAYYFQGFPVSVAGKTGTAQNPHGADHAWFVAFAPYENPEIAVAVLVEKGGHGGSAAAPVVKRILEAYFGFAQAEN